MASLVLSLFPGIDLLGRAFEEVGYTVVRGPDLVTGGDIRSFRGVAGAFDGVIGGPPCQGFSCANPNRGDADHHSVKYSLEMLAEYRRVVSECEPTWFVCENVPAVPDLDPIHPYGIQRISISDAECGGSQLRVRHIQFGHKLGHIIRPQRVTPRAKRGRKPAPVTTKMSKWVSAADACRRQGFEPIKLPGWSKEAKMRAIGNGVPKSIGLAIAKAVSVTSTPTSEDCPCGCGRVLTGRQKSATVACRKRLSAARNHPVLR